MPDYSVTPAQQQSFLATIKPLCIAAAQRTGCPASILGAQAILESFWGLGDEVPARAKNLFGQKDLGGDPYRIGVESFPTTEYDAQNRPYTVTDPFNLYPSWQASIDAHADYITGRLDGYSRQRYLDPKMPTDPAAFARWLVTSPRQYATDSTYPASLMGLVGKWGLRDWDTPTKGWWQPNPGTSITCMLGADAAKAVTPATDAHIVDLDALTPALVAAQHAAGKRIIAYLSAGTAEDYRADVKTFPAAALGKRMSEWPEERWLDVRQPGVLTVIKARIDRAAALGVDGIDPDNVDGYDNAADAGIVLSKADCATYVQAIADYAHSRGLACGLKNAIDLIGSVSVDYYINEQAGEYGEADAYATVVKSKPVLCIEYSRKGYDAPHPAGMQVSLYASNQALDAPPIAVKGLSALPPTTPPVVTPPPTTPPAASWDALDRLVGLTPRTDKAWGAERIAVGQAIVVSYPKGSASPSSGAAGGCQRLYRLPKPVEEVTVSYTATLPADFDAVKGGKLGWGLWGGDNFDGGKRPDGTDGLSARIMWRAGLTGEAYIYAAQCPAGAIDTGKGFSVGRGFALPVGRPVTITQHLKLNTPGRANGALDVTIDGQSVISERAVLWRTVPGLQIEGVFLSTFFGGGDSTWATPRDQAITYGAPTLTYPGAPVSTRSLYNEALLDSTTTALCVAAQKRLAAEGIRFWVAEGYSTDPSHAGTHAGDGVFDVHGSTRTWAECVRTAEVLRELGCGSWARSQEHGGMIQHVHAVVLDHPGLSTAAQQQARAYLAGFNGLGAGFRSGPDYHTRAYVNNRWPSLAKPAPIPTTAPAAWTHRVIASSLNVRTGPSTSNPIITTVSAGARLRIAGYSGDWVGAVFEGGTIGWVHHDYITSI